MARKRTLRKGVLEYWALLLVALPLAAAAQSNYPTRPIRFIAPYAPIKDFAPVGTIYTSEFVLVAANVVPANTVQELIALAKAKQGIIPFPSTPEELAALMKSDLGKYAKLIKAANIKLEQ